MKLCTICLIICQQLCIIIVLMVNYMMMIIFLLLILQIRAANPAPSNSQIFCSAFCAPTGCNGWTSSDCNTKCNTAKGWTNQGGPCAVTNSAYQLLDNSDDAGGNIAVSPNTLSTNCANLTGYLGVAPYGAYAANAVVTITLAGGTSIGHYAIDLYFDIILIDIDVNPKWNSNTKMTVTLTNPSQALTLTLNNASPSTYYKYYCGSNSNNQQYFQYQNTYKHNLTDTDIAFTITTDNAPGTAALWVAKEFIYVMRLCTPACLTCNTTGTNNVCFSCDISLGYMLNNFSCLTTCTTGYGQTSDPAICIWCDLHCKTCYEVFNNCTVCQPSGTYSSFLEYNDTLGYYLCVKTCSNGSFSNTTLRTCDLCDPVCATCTKNATYCQSCISGYGWSNYYCYQPCSEGYYYSNNNTNCTQCNLTCISCTDQLTCSACTLNGTNIGYLLGVLCYSTCPTGFFGDTNYNQGPNTCVTCATSCLTCTANPNPCQSCKNGSYLYNSTCGSTCPNGTIAYSLTNVCLDCSLFCVDLTINMYFPNYYSEYVYIDMTFTKDMDFIGFDMTTFQTVSIASVSSSDYTVTYQLLTSNSYRIILEPTGYIFLYNDTVTVTTKSQPAILETANDSTPFKPSNYGKTATISWFLLKSPSMSDNEKAIINQVSAVSSIVAKVTTSPFVAEIKKSGVLAMFFSGAQITTCSIFINSIPSQNMYEGVRFWGVYVFYDVPQWEQNSKIPNHAFSPDIYDLVKNERRLFDMNTLYWRFQRIGASSFFIYDVYMPLLLILTCWGLALAVYFIRKSNKVAFKGMQSKYWTILHKIHEAAILYVTIAMMMEWMYFDAASGSRWISFIICLTFTLYFVGFELYVYYDMIKYPEAFIGNELYEYYLTRYGTYLKNLRFQQYDPNEDWSPKHWFRPYNYHILSYYKKFCMIVSLPIFYESEHLQPAVLIILQLLEIVRFVATKPYFARWRNVYRFVLQLLLLFFFIILFANTYIINYITLNDPNTLDFYVRLFYDIGWAGFAIVFTFNIGFIVQMFIDLARSFKFTNRELMEQARRAYYYDKIAEYEKEREGVPLNLMNRWVKLGNLNNRNTEELPDINIRVEYFKLVKHSEYFDVQIFKIVELFMNTDLNYHKENNTTAGKKIKKKIKLSKETSKPIFSLMCTVFEKYAKKNTEAIIIKTFTHISQRDFKAGDRIPLLPSEMFQKIELENHMGEKENIKLKQKLKGFPLNPFDLQSI